MNEKNTETIISIVGTAILTAFTIIKESTGINNLLFTVLFWIVVGISIAVAVFIAARTIRTYRYRHNMTDTSSILTRSHKAAKDIISVIKAVDKTISKYIRENDTLSDERKEQIKQVKKSVRSINTFQKKKVSRQISYFDNLTKLKIKEGLKALSPSQKDIWNLNQAVLESIDEIQRALLVLEQYDIRIYLGDYVLSHSSDMVKCAKALIDLKGWTYSLLGKTRLFKKSVQQGIDLLKKYLKENNLPPEKEKEVYLLLARAYRHLGSDIIVARNSPEEAIESNNEANRILYEHFTKEEFETNNKVREMHVGIEFGILSAQLSQIKKNKNRGNEVRPKSWTLIV